MTSEPPARRVPPATSEPYDVRAPSGVERAISWESTRRNERAIVRQRAPFQYERAICRESTKIGERAHPTREHHHQRASQPSRDTVDTERAKCVGERGD